MGFASTWLHSWSVFPKLIVEAPHRNTGIITVVPSCNEPAIIDLLDSLANTDRPACRVEVIIVVNAPSGSGEEILKNNRLTLENIESWKMDKTPCFRLFSLNVEKPELKGWGVGLARKTGMDEALRRFDSIDRPDGVIVCLDGDCRVKQNYFQAIEEELLNRNDRKACSVCFEHPLGGKEFSEEIYNSVIQYELHLRYYYQALKYTGYPDVFHTVGSSIAVKALTYMKAGGMNRRQAGEDFYFVQKLLPAGGYFSLNSTTVYPSPRISERVPFGTGHSVGSMVDKGERVFMTYNPEAFKDLRIFFEICERSFRMDDKDLDTLYTGFPDSIKSFMSGNDWKSKIKEIRENTAGFASFRKRFYEWFNMFRIVKYLNNSHLEIFAKVPAGKAVRELPGLSVYDRNIQNDVDLLMILRKLETSL